MKLHEIGRGIQPDEFISVGKYWLWMTVFSSCLFASCGETNRNPQEPASPEPQAQAVSVGYDRDMIRVEEIEPSDHFDTGQLEEFPDADADDLELEGFESDLEHFEEDEDIQPDIVHEVR